MIPQALLHTLQSSAKFFFDLDPVLTEHLTRHMTLQISAIGHMISALAIHAGERFADIIVPVTESLSGLKMELSEV